MLVLSSEIATLDGGPTDPALRHFCWLYSCSLQSTWKSLDPIHLSKSIALSNGEQPYITLILYFLGLKSLILPEIRPAQIVGCLLQGLLLPAPECPANGRQATE